MGKITLVREEGTDLLFAGYLSRELDKYNFSRDVSITVEPMCARSPNPPEIQFSQDYSWAEAYPPKFSFYALPSWREQNVRILGKNSALVTYAADPIDHAPKLVEKTCDVGFVGRRYYPERSKYLKAIESVYPRSFLNLDALPGSKISDALSRCKVLFNHTRPEIDVNLRFFEAMALGCQVMLRTPALEEFAKEGVHYLGYSSPEEAIEVIQKILKDNDLRQKITYNARSHFLANHTYAHRAQAIINHLTEYYENSSDRS